MLRRTAIRTVLFTVIGLPEMVGAACRDLEAAPRSPKLRILVPAYFYPAGPGLAEWDALIAAAKDVPVVAITNPASGPGEKVDPAYTQVLQRAIAAGVTVVGYVSTSYAKRPIADVEADVAGWPRLYPGIQGIFFDEQVSSAASVDYYATLYAAARAKVRNGLVINNPGVPCAEEYFSRPATDVGCIFEHHEGFDLFHRPSWKRDWPRERFAGLVYRVAGQEAMQQAVRKAVRERLGYFYVTDAGGVNPWDRLPTYWKAEVAEVRRINRERQR